MEGKQDQMEELYRQEIFLIETQIFLMETSTRYLCLLENYSTALSSGPKSHIQGPLCCEIVSTENWLVIFYVGYPLNINFGLFYPLTIILHYYIAITS